MTINLVILGSFLHYWIWSLCNQPLPQFSIDHFQNLHTLCQHNEDVHVEYDEEKHGFDGIMAF